MRLYFIRHGDKEPGDFYSERIGHQDNILSERGRAEARALLRYFARRPVERIFASRYGRTSETASPLASERSLSPIVDPRLDEIDVGVRDKLDDAAFAAAYPDFMAEYLAKKTDFRYPGGESGSDVVGRIAPFLAERAEEGLDAACFTHDGFIRILMCHLLGLPPWDRFRFAQDTCGVLELELRQESRPLSPPASPEPVAAALTSFPGEPENPARLFTIVRFNQVMEAD